ncbi:MAG: DUF802 domain-containing protein [Burkholderiales bacterium PBB5]|nr:MAG: DUF802 domain-containing protein [Burkholderiales bacterium PBB5]
MNKQHGVASGGLGTLGVSAFGLGALAVGWVAWGYAGHNLLALAMTAVIAGFYLMGGLELRRFHQATTALDQALAAIPQPLATLSDWLGQVPASLRNPVRLRVEGERVGLPGPALTPYLLGLLVLLGMLGTFLGMVVTLNGAVLALESTTDLATIRAALAAPVKGLGLAFGTSLAGVAASAMLGLVSALCRRARLLTAQRLDSAIAGALRGFSRVHQREESFKTLQAQGQALPQLVASVQDLMAQMAAHSQQLGDRLLANQESFQRSASAAYTGLAASVDQSLQRSLSESARLTGATIAPVVQATLDGLAQAAHSQQAALADSVQRQLAGLAERLDTGVGHVAQTWTQALDEHRHSSQALTSGLQQALAGFNDGFAQRAEQLLAGVQASQASVHSTLLDSASGLAQQASAQHERQSALLQHHASKLLADLAQAQQAAQAQSASQDQQRQAALAQALEAMADRLQQAWQQAGAQGLAQQQQICQILEATARQMQADAQAQALQTTTEISALMQAAAQAPRAAAEVIERLRAQLSDSLARDNAALAERNQLMATLGSLLAAVNQAATEQRSAIDALVASAAALLQQAGGRFEATVQAQAGQLDALATQVGVGAVEVAALGQSLGAAVQQFGDASGTLVGQLQQIAAALATSSGRGDEQLAYDVAQAGQDA